MTALFTADPQIGTPYWWEPSAPQPTLTDALPTSVDILVIGAGYAGLSAALHAHDAGAKVAVVEAGWPGRGASTRNGGMFGAHPRLPWEDLARLWGAETADALFAEAGVAQRFVEGLIDREKIDAGFQRTGRVVLAWTEADHDRQKKLAEVVATKSDVPVRLFGREDLGEQIATEAYYGGILFPEHGAVNPRKFHDGLLCAVLNRGIPVVPDCGVRALDRTTGGFRATTPHGVIRADKVVLATNGYTPQAFPWHRRRVFPLPSFIIATEPLDPGLLKTLAPGGRMMVETRARYSYFRLSPDGRRVLWGGRASMRPLDLSLAAARLRGTMAQIWPKLGSARIDRVWCGNTGYSFSHMPNVGSRDGLHWAMGFSGSGTVMAPYLGAKAGLAAAGATGSETAYAATRLRPSLLNPFGPPWFLYAADLWYRYVVDRAQARQGRI